MPITPEERERRRSSVGGSDIAAILNLSPFANAHDVYLEKVVGTEDGSSNAMTLGNDCEPMLVQWAHQQERPAAMLQVDQRLEKVLDWGDGKQVKCHANLDGMMILGDERVGIEAKTSSMYDVFGEDGTDEIPDHVILQCQWQIWIADLKEVVVPVLSADGGLQRKLFRVVPNEDLLKKCQHAAMNFWVNHVVAKVPPEEVAPSLDTLARLKREPESVVDISDELVRKWLVAKQEVGQANKLEKEAKAELLASLGNAEGGTCELGMLTYMQQTRKAYEAKESTFRVARWKAVRK